MAADFPEHPFWDFSLHVYKQSGVAPACLEVQERHQLDVNILLFCCWLGASGRGRLDQGDMSRLVDTVDQWHGTVVRGLRAVRQAMKGGMPPAPIALSDPLRSRIAKTEVDCEHVEQLMLAAAVDRPESADVDPERAAGDAVANVARFFSAIGATPSPADAESIAVIFGPAFPGLAADRLKVLCDNLNRL